MPVLRKIRKGGAKKGERTKGKGKNNDTITMWWIVLLAIISVLLFVYLIRMPTSPKSRVEGFNTDENLTDIIDGLETNGLSKKPDMRNLSNTVNDYVLSKIDLDKSDHAFLKNIMNRRTSQMFNPTTGNIKYRIDTEGSFTQVDIREVDKIIKDSRGWRSMGWTFTAEGEEGEEGGGEEESGEEGGGEEESRGKGELDVIIYCKPREEMGKIFPEAHLLGLSVTDMGSRPKKIYLDETNWNNVPKGFEGSLEQYRQYVVQHEMGHVLDYPHQLPDGTKGEVDNEGKYNGQPVKGVDKPCPVMYQQTKGTKDRCRMNPWVSMEKK